MEQNETELKDELLAIKALLTFRTADKMIKIEGLSFLQQFDLTRAQYNALEILFQRGDMTIENLRKTIFETHGNITVVVRNLERDNYIIKTRSKKDRRCVLLSLTEKGKRKMEEITPLVKEHFVDIAKCLDEKDLQDLYRVCGKLRTELAERIADIELE